MNKCTILGANGYIARNFIKWCENNGIHKEYYFYDRDEYQKDKKKSYFSMDLTKVDCWGSVKVDVDTIYVFAGMSGTYASFDKPQMFLKSNELIIVNLLNQYVRSNSNARIIFLSSRLVYKGSSQPIFEDGQKECKTVYAASKLACEHYLEAYHAHYRVPYITLRVPVVYGSLIKNAEASSYGIINYMNKLAAKGEPIMVFGEGTQKRTISHIEDLAAILHLCGTSERHESGVFNVGGETLSIRQIAWGLSKKYGVEIINKPWTKEYEALESGDTVFNANRLETLMQYKPQKKFSEWLSTL